MPAKTKLSLRSFFNKLDLLSLDNMSPDLLSLDISTLDISTLDLMSLDYTIFDFDAPFFCFDDKTRLPRFSNHVVNSLEFHLLAEGFFVEMLVSGLCKTV